MLQRQGVDAGDDEEKPEDAIQPLLIQRQAAREEELNAPEVNSEEEVAQPLLLQREAEPGAERDEEREEHHDGAAPVQSCACKGACNCGPQTNRPVQPKSTRDQNTVQASGGNGGAGSGNDNAAVTRAIHQQGSGQPFNPKVQGAIESQTGFDMSSVRIHSDDTAHSANRSLRARAFTHGTDIWLGPGESPHDLRLLAHEAAHVVQQNSGEGSLQKIQRKPSDYQHPEDGGAVRGRLNQHFEGIDESDREEGEGEEPVNRAELRARSAGLRGETRPDVDRPGQERPHVEQTAAAVEREAETPPEPVVEAQATTPPEGESQGGGEALGAAEQAAALAQQAFAAASAQPEPAAEIEVRPPEPVMPVDSAGEPLEADPEAEGALARLADRAQYMREQGTLMRAQAAEGRGNAQIMRGNLARVTSEITRADEGIARSQEHATYRREVVGQAEQALGISEEKAATVAAEAPEYTAKADEGREDSGPMAGEANSLAAENAANAPEDEEAAENSREQGQQVNQVGSDSATMDSAISQTRERASSLGEDAARATEMNTETRGTVGASTQQLDQLDERLSQHTAQAGQARAQVESMASQPEDLHSRANQLEQTGQDLIASSFELESRLQEAQGRYASGAASVPAVEPWEGEVPGEEEGGEGTIQLQPNDEPVPSPTASDSAAGLTPSATTTTATTTTATPPVVPSAPTPAPVASTGPATPSAAATGPAVAPVATPTGLQTGAREAEEAEPVEPPVTAAGPAAEGEAEPEPAAGGTAPAQAAPEAADGGDATGEALPELVDVEPRERRQEIDVNQQLPPWMTGIKPESVERRDAAAQEQQNQRRTEIAAINEMAGGRPISQLGAGERLGIALRVVGGRYYNMVSNIGWPGWGGLARALLDPRSMLTGAVGGLNMILNAGSNLFSLERWRQDPLGNLLKSSADIATGLAIILGSITALAGLVAAIMGALILITFGFAAPIALPVIGVCTTIITTVGGWTIVVGKIALVLQALSLIKNLIDAATAQTASDLQREAGEIQSDINGGFAAAMSIVGAKGAQAGIGRLNSRVARTVRLSRRVGGARQLMRATLRAAPGRISRRIRRIPHRITQRARSAVTAITSLPGRGRDALRNLRDRLRNRLTRRRGSTPEILAEHPASGGHRVRVRGPNIELCSDCTNLSLVYSETLGSNPALNAEWRRLRDMARRADLAGDTRLAQRVARETARLERRLAAEGVIRGGMRYYPEESLLGSGKHGLDWQEGRARLIHEGKPQGQFGSPRDVHYAVEQAATLGPGGERSFPLLSDSRSTVWVSRGGTVQQVPAHGVWVKVYPGGKVHAFPVEHHPWP
jgi:hypothetical protein